MIAYSPIGNDTLTRTNYIIVMANAPAPALTITGPANVCAYGTSNVTYNAPLVSNVTYNWTVPSTVSIISGQGSRTLIVSFGASFTSGNISVTETNACGISSPKSLKVTRGILAPASISGPVFVCGLTSATYTVTAAIGASSYTWVLPSGVTSLTGTAPITTTGTTLTVEFATGFASGILSVKANNPCSSSGSKNIKLIQTPNTPGAITGITAVCGFTTSMYSINAVSGATSYIWTLPSGVESSMGPSPITIAGNSGISIPVEFDSSFVSGTISVKANNNWGLSPARSIFINKAPSSPVSISGNTTVCKLTTATYTVRATLGAVSYTWILPSGATSPMGGPL